jgi:hypothetical protein
MTPRPLNAGALVALALLVCSLGAGPALAQVTPAAGYTPPDDTPSFKMGATLFSDFTYTDEPTTTDVDGNVIHPHGFDVTRAYINFFGTINHIVSVRVTPDIARLSTKNGPNDAVSNSLDGSLTFRLKYAFGQFNLDNAWSKGSWVRFGVQQTPYVEWMENIYHYRFQGTTYTEREGYQSSSDFGLSAHYNFAGNYGDVHGGYYNGDTYKKAEANNQQAIEVRATLRPAPMVAGLKGLRLTAFYDGDHYAQSDARARLIGAVTYEHARVRAGFEYIDAKDQATAASTEVRSKGYDIWVTPCFGKGWEGLLRYDRTTPDKTVDAVKQRGIAGAAYWFQTQGGSLQAALLLDYERVLYDPVLNSPNETRYAFHTLFNF